MYVDPWVFLTVFNKIHIIIFKIDSKCIISLPIELLGSSIHSKRDKGSQWKTLTFEYFSVLLSTEVVPRISTQKYSKVLESKGRFFL